MERGVGNGCLLNRRLTLVPWRERMYEEGTAYFCCWRGQDVANGATLQRADDRITKLVGWLRK